MCPQNDTCHGGLFTTKLAVIDWMLNVEKNISRRLKGEDF